MIVSGQAIRLKVTKPYEQSALARILALVTGWLLNEKAPAELFIRRFARIYTPVVFLLALSIMLLPALVAAFHPGFDYFFKDWAYRGTGIFGDFLSLCLGDQCPFGLFRWELERLPGRGYCLKAVIIWMLLLTSILSYSIKPGTLTTGPFSSVFDGGGYRFIAKVVKYPVDL